jgi:hypothetical protein
MEFPKYYKNFDSYTCVLSSVKFVQVKKMRTVQQVISGENAFMVDDAVENDVECTEKEFTAAYRTAMELTACYVNEAHNLSMQKNNGNGTDTKSG